MLEKKSISVNRLLLVMVVCVLTVPLFIGRFFQNLTLGQGLVVSQLLYLLPVLCYLAVKRIRIREWVPIEKIRISTLLMSALFAILLVPLVTFLNLFSMFFVTNHVGAMSGEMQQYSLGQSLLLMALMPAVSEEFMFRGVFYHAYREKGAMIAALGSGLAFGLAHMNANQFCYAFVLGVAFSFLIEATGSILSAVVAHFVINGWSMVLLAILEPLQKLAGNVQESAQQAAALGRDEMLVAFAFYGVLAVVSTSLAVCVLVWISKHCKRLAHMKWCITPFERRPGEKRSFVTPVWIITVVICVIYMVLQG